MSTRRPLDPTATVEARRGPAAAASELKLVLVHEGALTDHLLAASGRQEIGRAREAHVCLDHPSVSRAHAALHPGERLEVEDLGSRNGTWVNQRRLAQGQRAALAAGDVLRVGELDLLVQPVTPAKPAGAPKATVIAAPAMQRLHQLARQLAGSQLSVLITGETGSGKDVLARALHEHSPRAKRPLVTVNCAALPENLLESELFGHEKGAFSGADRAKEGLLEAADGGTLFLDEVGELPLTMQPKLLRVLEDRQVLRVGATKPHAVDVRFVTATNKNLAAEAAAGRFRQDLYFRLNGMTLHVPPLRERPEEIVPLAQQLLKAQRRGATFTPEALAKLATLAWPGNVRELKNVVERAAVLAGNGPVGLPHLVLDEASPPPAPPAATGRAPLSSELADLERKRILAALEQCAGNQTRAAEVLGMPRRTLVAKLAQLGVPRPRTK